MIPKKKKARIKKFKRANLIEKLSLKTISVCTQQTSMNRWDMKHEPTKMNSNFSMKSSGTNILIGKSMCVGFLSARILVFHWVAFFRSIYHYIWRKHPKLCLCVYCRATPWRSDFIYKTFWLWICGFLLFFVIICWF